MPVQVEMEQQALNMPLRSTNRAASRTAPMFGAVGAVRQPSSLQLQWQPSKDSLCTAASQSSGRPALRDAESQETEAGSQPLVAGKTDSQESAEALPVQQQMALLEGVSKKMRPALGLEVAEPKLPEMPLEKASMAAEEGNNVEQEVNPLQLAIAAKGANVEAKGRKQSSSTAKASVGAQQVLEDLKEKLEKKKSAAKAKPSPEPKTAAKPKASSKSKSEKKKSEKKCGAEKKEAKPQVQNSAVVQAEGSIKAASSKSADKPMKKQKVLDQELVADAPAAVPAPCLGKEKHAAASLDDLQKVAPREMEIPWPWFHCKRKLEESFPADTEHRFKSRCYHKVMDLCKKAGMGKDMAKLYACATHDRAKQQWAAFYPATCQ